MTRSQYVVILSGNNKINQVPSTEGQTKLKKSQNQWLGVSIRYKTEKKKKASKENDEKGKDY